MVTQRSGWEMRFHTRQRALQFARAYAKLNPPVTLQVLGATGEVEAEESFEEMQSRFAQSGARLVGNTPDQVGQRHPVRDRVPEITAPQRRWARILRANRATTSRERPHGRAETSPQCGDD
jgi:hypothetical protein